MDLDAVEAAALEAVAGDWLRDAERVRRTLIARHAANGGSLSPVEVRAALAGLAAPSGRLDPERLLTPAARLGDAEVKAKTAVAVADGATSALTLARAKPAAAQAEASRRAGIVSLDTLGGLLSVLGPLGTARGQIGGAVSYGVQTAANEAVKAAAEEAGESYVFEPERDGCVECMSEAGKVGDQITEPPPLHPWCRCELVPFTDPAIPGTIKREATRSLLRGFSLPSESQAVRLRAARETLAKNPTAPASVKRYAETALKRGEFPRSRTPGGDR